MTTPELEALQRKLRRGARWIAASVAVVAGVVLVAWQRDVGDLFAFSQQQVPTAPATALIALMLALGLMANAREAQETSRSGRALARVLPWTVLALALLFVAAYAFGFEVPVEQWLAGPAETREGIVIGRISGITAALFAVIAVSLVIGHGRLADFQGRVAAVALGAAFLVLQGYVLGAPPLYGSNTIPVAAPTAILLLLLALASLLLSVPTSWPLRVLLPIGRIGVLPTPRNFISLALLLAMLVVSSGYFWFLSQRRRAETDAVSTLAGIAELKAAEISRWHLGLRSTAHALANAPLDAQRLRAVMGDTGSESRNEVRRWLAGVRAENGFEVAAIYATDGRELLRVVAPDARRTPLLREQLGRLAADSLHVSAAYLAAGALRQAFWVPLHLDQPRRNMPDAWIVFVAALDRDLRAALTDGPGNFRSGDFSLWQVERDSVRAVLGPFRKGILPMTRAQPRDSLYTRILYEPLASPLGYVGPGFDSALVRAVMRPVQGTPWQLVAMVDESELGAPALAAAARATVLSLAFLLSVGALTYALWYRRDLARTQMELALIAERERSVREVEASEQRYARAMRGTTDGLWDMNMITGEAYVSPRWREIAQIPADAPVRNEEEFLSFIHPDDVPRQRAAMQAHVERGEPYDLELRLHPRLGLGTRWIRTRAEVERDASGRPVWMAGAITDITRQQLAEAKVRQTERVLRVRSAVNRAIVRSESEAALLQTICDIGVRVGGYRMAWIGCKMDDAEKSVHPVAVAGDERGYLKENPITWGDGPRGQGPTGRCIRTQQVQVAQDLLAERNYAPWREAARERGFQSSASIPLVIAGQVFGGLMLYSAEPHAFDAEEVDLLTVLGEDISFGIGALRNFLNLQQQQEQLTLFRQAIDRSADAIFVADVATGTFVDFNVACLHQLGYSAEELSRLGPADIVSDLGARGGLGAVVNAVREAGGIVRASLHRRKDGSEVPVEVALSVLDLGGRTLILGIARDISDRLKADSDREELQQMLNRAQKMESVGRLAGGVAHDFNNLLTVINTTAELALGEAPEDSALRRDLLEIRAAGNRAAALTRQLLAFSRQQVLKREVLALNDVVSGFLKLVSRVIGEDIHLEVRLGHDVPNIEGDANQLEQVLMNLCVNARDAMPRGGTLTIGTGTAIVDDEHAARREGMSAGRYATLSITDTGIGIDKATQAKIFEPFFTTKEVGRGTGLGLSTVYGIVKQSGGSIWVYSEVGKGTTFKIYLPITEAQREAASVTPSRAALSGRETILVVEDEASIRMVARRVLERAGYTVLEADSGLAALGVIDAAAPKLDLVMTDLVMPGMTGIELAAELRQRRPNLKVLFTSGYSADAVADRLPHDGDWNFIAKPYGMQELVVEIRRILDS